MTDARTYTPITDYQMQALTAALNPDRVAVKQRMSYLEAWDVKATLIRVFGFGGFSSELIESEIVKAEQVQQVSDKTKTNWSITAKATVRLTIHQTGAVYTEAAIAGSKQPDFTECADMALKSAESDALKRAAIFLGTQFGLSLYNNGATNDIVKVVLAPDQIWPISRREQIEAQHAAQVAGAIIDGQPAQQNQTPGVPAGSTLTPEQHAQAQALVERGLRMKAEREQTPEEFAAAAAAAAQEPGVPAALDPSLEPGFEEQHAETVAR
jgi:hypothetical protein